MAERVSPRGCGGQGRGQCLPPLLWPHASDPARTVQEKAWENPSDKQMKMGRNTFSCNCTAVMRKQSTGRRRAVAGLTHTVLVLIVARKETGGLCSCCESLCPPSFQFFLLLLPVLKFLVVSLTCPPVSATSHHQVTTLG